MTKRSLEEIIRDVRVEIEKDATDWKTLHSEAVDLFFMLVQKEHSGEEIAFIGHMLQRMGDGLMTGGMVMKLLVEHGVIKSDESERDDTSRMYG